MKISEHIEWHLNQLKTETVNAIKTIIEKEGANAIELNVGVVINEISDQESETISEIYLDGKVTYGSSDNESETHLFDLSLDLLVVVLKELEEKKFNVFEENQ